MCLLCFIAVLFWLYATADPWIAQLLATDCLMSTTGKPYLSALRTACPATFLPFFWCAAHLSWLTFRRALHATAPASEVESQCALSCSCVCVQGPSLQCAACTLPVALLLFVFVCFPSTNASWRTTSAGNTARSLLTSLRVGAAFWCCFLRCCCASCNCIA